MVTINNDTSICYGSTAQLLATGGIIYNWSPQAGLNNSNTAAPLALPAVTTNYIVSVEDAQGCRNTADVTITVQYPPVVNLGPDTSFCTGISITLDGGSGHHSYLWHDHSVTQTFVADATGQYWVRVGNNCGFFSDTIVVTANPLPVVDLGGSISVCESDVVILDAGNPGSDYLWSSGVVNQTFAPGESGIYWVKVTNEFNCQKADTATLIINPLPFVELGVDTFLCSDDKNTISLNASDIRNHSYLWQDGSREPVYIASDSGTYRVEVSNSCGVAEDVIHIKLEDCECKLFVPNAFTPNGDGTNDFFKPISFCNLTDYNLLIFDRWGEKLFESHDVEVGWDGLYLGNMMNPGVYVYYINYAGHENSYIVTKGVKGSLTLLR